jgi:hypothetical protein
MSDTSEQNIKRSNEAWVARSRACRAARHAARVEALDRIARDGFLAPFEPEAVEVLRDRLEGQGFVFVDDLPAEHCEIPEHFAVDGSARLVAATAWDAVLMMERDGKCYTFLLPPSGLGRPEADPAALVAPADPAALVAPADPAALADLTDRVERTKSFITVCRGMLEEESTPRAMRPVCHFWDLHRDNEVYTST